MWRTRRIAESTCFILCWATFCVAFFSISRSKLPGYVLPALPAVGLLIAHDISHRLQQRLGHVRWLCLGVGLTFIGLGAVADRLGDRIHFFTDIRPAPTVTQFSDLLIFSGIVIGTLGLLRAGRVPLTLAAIVLPVFMILGTGNLWELDAEVSARPAANGAKNHLPLAELDTATTYKLQRGLKFALNFYLHRELTEWTPPAGHSSIIFTTQSGSKELKQVGIRCLNYIVYPAVEICVDSSTVVSLTSRLPSSGEAQQEK